MNLKLLVWAAIKSHASAVRFIMHRVEAHSAVDPLLGGTFAQRS